LRANPLALKVAHASSHARRHCSLQDAQLVDADLTHRDATLAFVWSQIRGVADPSSLIGRAKVNRLCFQDFMEALVRVAMFKAMPTDKAVAAGVGGQSCVDAGDFLIALREHDRGAYVAFLKRVDEPDYVQERPSWEQLEGMLTLLLRTIKDRIGLGRRTQTDEATIRRGSIAQAAERRPRHGSIAAAAASGDVPPPVIADLSIPLTIADVHRFIVLNSSAGKRSRALQ